MFSANNPEAVRRMYLTDDALRVRQETHDRFTVPPTNFVNWALSCIKWRGDEVILDVGAGPGRWFENLHEAAPRYDLLWS